MQNVGKDRIKELEEQIADLKARWPEHSVPPFLLVRLEELEEELEEAKKAQEKANDQADG